MKNKLSADRLGGRTQYAITYAEKVFHIWVIGVSVEVDIKLVVGSFFGRPRFNPSQTDIVLREISQRFLKRASLVPKSKFDGSFRPEDSPFADSPLFRCSSADQPGNDGRDAPDPLSFAENTPRDMPFGKRPKARATPRKKPSQHYLFFFFKYNRSEV